jgi:signal transduction histidine kinase/ligand-binding sensor domain-containing protein/DNA-binding response OmpR family regulator
VYSVGQNLGSDFSFKHLSVENGLSQSSVFSIYKDSYGFMWFGTRRGLNCYDGVSFKYYVHNPSDSTSISSNLIYSVISDKYNNLLIQTDNGINYYNRYSEKFIKVPAKCRMWNFIADEDQQIWAVGDSGLFKFSPDNYSFLHILKGDQYKDLFDITIDRNENIWITNPKGVFRFNSKSNSVKIYPIPNQSVTGDFFIEYVNNKDIWICLDNSLYTYSSVADNFVGFENDQILQNSIINTFNNGLGSDLLVGTDGNGFFRLNTQNHQWEIYNHIPDDSKSLSGNTVYSLYADNKPGIIWVGQYMAGIDYGTNYSSGFNFIYHNQSQGIINNNVRCLLTDNNQNVWIGTRQGISVYAPEGKIYHFDEKMLLRSGLKNSIITKLWQDKAGYIWICAYKGGIVLYHPVKKAFIKPEVVYPQLKLPSDLKGVFDMLLDRNENLWLATGAGTFLIPKNKKGFLFHKDFSKCLLEDRAGRIFIGLAYTGVLSVNNNSLSIIKSSLDNVLHTFDARKINTLLEDDKGNIWIGTGGDGIFCYNPSEDKEIKFAEASQLSDKYITALAEDSKHYLWVTTYSGLVKFNPDSGKLRNIYFEGGIKGKEFNPDCITQTKDGIIFAGSTNGLLYFNPIHYWEDKFTPNIVFTGFYVNNKRYVASDNAHVPQTEITLNYNQNTIGIEFSAPDYYHGDKVNFFYNIKELSDEWIALGNRRFIDFFRLDPGKYTLVVKAANGSGYEHQGTTLTIVVKKPLWRSNLAILIYLLVLLAIGFFIRKEIKSRLKLKYQVFIEKIEQNKQKEINQTRLRFFSDISHEIGTFLTLINLPVETLNEMEDNPVKKHYMQIIDKNLKRLQLLVNRILTLRRIETGNLRLRAEKDDITAFVKSLSDSFKPLCINSDIRFSYSLPGESIITWFDKELTEHIVYNLLSNALKHTPSGGEIKVSLKKATEGKEKFIEIDVFNSGSYFSQEKADSIFSHYIGNEGQLLSSGMGLHLAKQYTEIHKGKISFVSEQEKGVTFTVKIPFGDSYMEIDEKIKTNTAYQPTLLKYIESEKEIEIHPQQDISDEKGKSLILYIEKNSDLKHFITGKLGAMYRFAGADDVEEGIMKAKNLQPDLILSDINIGNEESLNFCKKVKNDIDISHIPLVIFTLQENTEEQIEGLKMGADAFVTKPISLEYLSTVIGNLIDSRKKLKLAFSAGYDLPDPSKFSSLDQKFLRRVYKIIEDNLSNPELGIPYLLKEMGTSKYMLYNKLNTLTGQTPNDFIVNYRLKRAAALLKDKNIKDTDIYMDLGFREISYFRKCFKKQFGITPVQFARSNTFN